MYDLDTVRLPYVNKFQMLLDLLMPVMHLYINTYITFRLNQLLLQMHASKLFVCSVGLVVAANAFIHRQVSDFSVRLVDVTNACVHKQFPNCSVRLVALGNGPIHKSHTDFSATLVVVANALTHTLISDFLLRS